MGRNNFLLEFMNFIEVNHKEYLGADNGLLRLSLLKTEVIRKMKQAKSLEEIADISSAYESVTHNNPI